MTITPLISRNSLLALIAAKEALASAKWDSNRDMTSGAVMATTVGGMDLNEQYYKSLLQDDSHKDIIMLLDSADCTVESCIYGRYPASRHHNIYCMFVICQFNYAGCQANKK